MKSKFRITSTVALLFFLFLSLGSFANKTSVKIIAPETAEAGTEITVKIEVTHIGNTKAHFTNWVIVKVNGEVYKKWGYTKDSLPETQDFTLEFKIVAKTDLEIIAEGNCNKHGSKGEDSATIKVLQSIQ